ncbi:MAG TPA: aminoglycoside phosphotransferase family protein [Acidimicrobiales bacterium]|nr:aminoglycoside phosphotransferase family protein [Acidimicrobiales bacterium]
MRESEIGRAVAAGMSIVTTLDLTVEDAVVIHNSNRLAVRLRPCEVLARVAPVGARDGAEFEVLLARRLGETNSPVAELDPRVEPRVYLRDDFAVTLWTHYEAVANQEVSPSEYAQALKGLHAGMRQVDVTVPHFTDRVATAQSLVGDPQATPDLPDEDRKLLRDTLRELRDAVVDRGADEQILHGEPHPGNLLATRRGPLFVDLETCCRGPVEFDVAHAPEEVGRVYPAVDPDLLRDCRVLTLAVATTWRWDRRDQLPSGRQLGEEWLGQIRSAVDW